jgi:hypothetical protein
MKRGKMKKYLLKHHHEHDECCSTSCHCGCGKCGGGVYFLGFIGSAVYYLQQSTGFWQGVVGILKAIVWPAFLVFKMLGA